MSTESIKQTKANALFQKYFRHKRKMMLKDLRKLNLLLYLRSLIHPFCIARRYDQKTSSSQSFTSSNKVVLNKMSADMLEVFINSIL